VSVQPKAEVYEIENRRRLRFSVASSHILPMRLLDCATQPASGECVRVKRRVLQQTFPQMSEVAVRIACWRDPLVHLKYVNRGPRDFFIRQHAEHHPRSVTSAYRHKKEAALVASRSGVLGDNGSRPRCHGFCIPKHFKLHESLIFFSS
jgi:hypothetical protein